MPRTNISRCTIPTKKGNANLYIKVKNNNESYSRQFQLNAYANDASANQSLPIYTDNELMTTDTLEPGTQKVYKVDVSSIEGKVVFEIIQKNGGSGIKVSRNSKNPSTVELQIK